MTTTALIVGAGRGHRMGGAIPKQYRNLGGQPVLRHTLTAFLTHPGITTVQAVIHADDLDLYTAAAAGLALPPPVIGGATRQASVRLGLESLAAANPAKVLIHDAVRPFIAAETITASLAILDQHPAAIAGVPVCDTLKREDNGTIAATVDRTGLWRAQTPQAFRFDAILAAHRALRGQNDLTDDAAVAEAAGIPVRLVRGTEDNIKITTEHDLVRGEHILRRHHGDAHVGFGIDARAFGPGDHIRLCGLPIPHDRGIAPLPVADVALNALRDALLGTLGGLTPTPDPDAALPDVVAAIRRHGGILRHVDVTVICERPKVGPHRAALTAALAETLGLPADRVGIKATTTEGLGFAGRREGIAAQAVATVSFPTR